MTNKEIAKTLGISPAALSLILNHKPGVSTHTREQILQKIHQMGYSHLIKPVASQNPVTRTICFIVYLKDGRVLNQHPFFLLLMESIESHARKSGYHITLITMDASVPVEEQLKSAIPLASEGIILLATEMLDEDVQPFLNLPLPCIAIDNAFAHSDISTVAINNQLGTFQAVEYLFRQGHRKIGYLHSLESISSFDERRDGYLSAMKHFNLELPSDDIYYVHYSEEESFQDIYRIFKDSPVHSTAFICDDDTIASGALRAFRMLGYKMPEDISLVGFNDRPNASLTQPSLTTINVPKSAFGAAAVDSIINLIGKKENNNSWTSSLKTRVGTKLVIRDSVKKL